MLQLAAVSELSHQSHGFFGDAKPYWREARHEAGHAQHAQGIFGEGLGNMAQHAILDVFNTAIGIDKIAFAVLGDGIDG